MVESNYVRTELMESSTGSLLVYRKKIKSTLIMAIKGNKGVFSDLKDKIRN